MNLVLNHWRELDLSQRRELLQRPAVAADASVQADVRRIVDSVRASGDIALSEFSLAYDDAQISDFRVSADLSRHQI